MSTLQYKAIDPERPYLHVRSATAQCFTFEVCPA